MVTQAAETPEKIFKIIEEREKVLNTTTWKRMDVDRELVLKPYRWQMFSKAANKLVDVAGASHVTLPFSKIKLFKTNAIMSSSKRVLQVKGNDKEGKPLTSEATGIIVDFCERILKMADKRLTSVGQWPLKPWWVEQMNWRGGIAARCLLSIEDKDGKQRLIVNIQPWDIRFVSYEYSENDMEWIAYQTNRPFRQVNRDYSKDFTTDVIVRDYWRLAENLIFGDEVVLKPQKNPFKHIPVVLKFCQSGNMLQDSDENVWKARGESIFAADRELFPLGNETASMLQSMSIRSYKPALTFKSPDGTVELESNPWEPGSVTSIAEGEEVNKIPMDDIKLATQLMQRWYMDCLELTGISMSDMGEIAFPQSSIVVQQMINKRNEILLPRLETFSEGYSELLHMAIKQYIELDKAVELGRIGDMKEFKPSDLEGNYDVICEHHPIYPEQNMADLSLANAQLGWFKKQWIMENTFKQKDPDNIVREKDIENAESSIPAFAYMRLAHQLEAEGKHDEATLLAQMANSTLKALLSGQFDPNKLGNVRPPVQNDNLTAVMAGQNTGTSTVTPARAKTNQTRQTSVQAGAQQ